MEYSHASLVAHRSNVEGSCAQEMSLIGVCHEILQTSFASNSRKLDWLTWACLGSTLKTDHRFEKSQHSLSFQNNSVCTKEEASHLSATDSKAWNQKSWEAAPWPPLSGTTFDNSVELWSC
jgi:hypothetical protein